MKKNRVKMGKGLIIFIWAVIFFLHAAYAGAGGEIKLTTAMQNEVGSVIRQFGYNCPEPKLAYAKGQDAYGTVVKIFCGPAGQAGVYPKAVYRVTFTPDDRIIIKPWE